MDKLKNEILNLRNLRTRENRDEINNSIKRLIRIIRNLEKVRKLNEKKIRNQEKDKIKKLRKLNERNTKLVNKLREKNLIKNKKKQVIFDLIENADNKVLKEFGLTRNRALRFKNLDTLNKHIDKFKKWVRIDALVYYRKSDQEVDEEGELLKATIIVIVNKLVAENTKILEKIISKKFYEQAPRNNEHFAHSQITEIDTRRRKEVKSKEIILTKMRFAEGNDCVFKEIYKGIKDCQGYKNYNIDKIKNEFIELGIDIKDGVSFKEVKKWITDYEHRITCYFFGPDFILKDFIKGFRNTNIKIPQLIFLYNNNHCYSITDEKIKQKIIKGGRKDISDLNPVSNYKFDSFKHYTCLEWDNLKTRIEKRGLHLIKDEVILSECKSKEGNLTFVKLIQFLLSIDETQINFIDYKKECVFFDGKIIFRVNNYNDRKGLCYNLNKYNNTINFNFSNKHYASIGMDLYKFLNGGLEKSYYNSFVKNLVDNYYIEPVHFGGNNYKEKYGKWKYKVGGDCPKSYSNGIIKYFGGVKLPVLSIFDNFIKKEFIIDKVYDNLLYLIEGIEYRGKKWTDISLCPYFIIENLIKRGCVVRCLGYIKYTKYVNGDGFVKFVEKSYENDLDGKSLVNCFSGLLNKKFQVNNRGFITKDEDIVNSAIFDGYDVDCDLNSDIDKRVWVCKWKDNKRIDGDYNLLYQSIIWGGILNLFDLTDYIYEKFEDLEIVGCNTDAVYFLSNKYYENKNCGKFRDKNYKIGEDEYKEKMFLEFDKREFIFEKRSWKMSCKESYLFNSDGGLGKTEKGVTDNKNRKLLCMAFENSSVNTLRERCVNKEVIDFKCMTINKCLGIDAENNENGGVIDFSQFEVIIIDELFRICPYLLTKLYFELMKFKGKLILIGHSSQIKYISNEKYRYDKCDCIGELVGFNYFKFSNNEINEKLKTGKMRYDLKTFKMLRNFEKKKSLKGYVFKKVNEKLKTNIVRINKVKDKINLKFSKGVSIGDKCILEEHYEKFGYFKGHMFIVEKIENEVVNDIFKIEDVKLNYGTTSHKYQGRTIREEYNILEGKRSSFEVMYTNLSRATNMENIHIKENDIKEIYKSEYDGFVFNEMLKENLSGEIYVVYCKETGFYYIGMTLRNKEVRFLEHITDENSTVFKEMKSPEVKLIGVVYGNEKLIRDFERDYIIEYKRKYGKLCINKTNFKDDKMDVVGWNVLELKKYGFVNENVDKKMFRISYKNENTGNWEEIKKRYTKLGREIVYENVINLCNEKFGIGNYEIKS